MVLGCIFVSSLVGYRIQSQIYGSLPNEQYRENELSVGSRRDSVDYFYSKGVTPFSERELVIVPPPPPLVDNATFFSLPASERALTPLRDIDKEQYTIRILS